MLETPTTADAQLQITAAACNHFNYYGDPGAQTALREWLAKDAHG
jgi:hypothetical protein